MSETAQTHNDWNSANRVALPPKGVVRASGQHTEFVIHAAPADVANYAREGNDLIVGLRDGGHIRIEGFFAQGANFNHLVFAYGNRLLMADFSVALTPGGDGIADLLVTYHEQQVATDAVDTSGLLPILGTLAAGGVGMASGGAGAVAVALGNTPCNCP